MTNKFFNIDGINYKAVQTGHQSVTSYKINDNDGTIGFLSLCEHTGEYWHLYSVDSVINESQHYNTFSSDHDALSWAIGVLSQH